MRIFKMGFWLVPVALLALLVLPFQVSAQLPTETLDFNRDIRPILSDNCFHCHGPDKQRSKLRLDVRDIPIEKWAIVPGEPGESEMITRITSEDPEFHMPPPEANRELTKEQIETLRTWISEGAEYRRHWAFEPIPSVSVPEETESSEGERNPIDAYVLRRLEQEGIAPRGPADLQRLLRRVTLDLTGLPPSPEEMQSLLVDEDPDAYEKAVERLLASPHYGEQRALEWLDLARYADTHGYQADRENYVWPWRDWLIRAFNENLGYDEFARWQLAGDLLPDPSQDQMVATAFNRLHRQTNEGGIVPEEFLVEYSADRTQTFSTAFLGLTMECARCHDHKFDPISQKEYYETFSFFSNIDESSMYPYFTEGVPTPNMFVYGEGEADEHEKLKEAIREAEAEIDQIGEGARSRFEEWRESTDGAVTPSLPLVYLPFEYESEETTPNLAGALAPATMVGAPQFEPGRVGRAIRFAGNNHVELKHTGDFERTDPFSTASWLRLNQESEWTVVYHHSVASLDAASRGYEFMFENGHAVFALNHFWPGNAIRVKTVNAIPLETWTHVAVTYDGSSRASGVTIYMNGDPAPVDIIRDNLYDSIRYHEDRSYSEPTLRIGARLRDPGFKNGAVDEFMLFSNCLTPLEVKHLARSNDASTVEDMAVDDGALFEYYLARFDGEYATAASELKQAREAEQALVSELQQLMIMREKPASPTAYVYERGAYDQPGEKVSPNTPNSILPFPQDLPRNRLGLAEWLVQRDHPLTARVAVNRYWKTFFGRGLVDTMEDFGSQGTMPSHPELLDFLAAWFIDSDWDVKALCKLIVSSSTYRQDSNTPSKLTNRDPQNILLARGPRHRLTAEQLRDSVLAASGLLTRTIGGPSVKPYQPDGLWIESAGLDYTRDIGSDLYRRSMYTFWKRTVPPPSMLMFDAVNRETCVAQREVTVTPLQALVLLNDPQFVEAARVLASKVIVRHGSLAEGAMREIFQRLIGREPRKEEMLTLVEAFDEQQAIFSGSEDDAKAFLGVGDTTVDDAYDPATLAAMTTVVQMVMNLNEFQVKS